MSEAFLNGKVVLHGGDCLDILPTLPTESIDAVVCDPPYGISFMGRAWDHGVPSVAIWSECLRVLKPGGYIVAFSSSRTFGRMSVALEDAGFITHPMIGWLFGSGFPKATRIKAEGYEGFRYGAQALKPALEPIYMGQKPFSEATGTANILRHGTGALNIDGCRISTSDTINQPSVKGTLCGTNGTGWDRPWKSNEAAVAARDERARAAIAKAESLGRWPANLIHDGSDEVVEAFPETQTNGGGDRRSGARSMAGFGLSNDAGDRRDGADSGSAARFFYAAKADSDDRIGSRHPTVKPLDLMQYLVRLVTPPGGLVLDPFAGTGTTGEAAIREGMRAVLIEREAEYRADIARRMALCLASRNERRRAIGKERVRRRVEDHAGTLFADLRQEAAE